MTTSRHAKITGNATREQVIIDQNLMLHGRIVIDEQGTGKVGKNSSIRQHSVIGSVKRVRIGERIIISNNVTIMDNNNHPTDVESRKK